MPQNCASTGRSFRPNKDEYTVAFQSRFGKQEWLKPYLASTLEDLGKAKTKRIDVICPGFSSDCLETLEEIAMEGKKSFKVMAVVTTTTFPHSMKMRPGYMR